MKSDFPYPKPAGKWYELKVEANPYPQQIRALELIRDGVGGSAYMMETVFNPWNVAQKLSSKEEVLRLKDENPQALMDALDAITRSEINHARRVLAIRAWWAFYTPSPTPTRRRCRPPITRNSAGPSTSDSSKRSAKPS